MTDEPDDFSADPEAEEVRRLLASARHTGPMPADVADRMDAVLAGLAAGPDRPLGPRPESDPVVVSLATRRRRRAAAMLVAAATIVVGGVVAAQQLPRSGSQSGASASAADRAEDSAGLGTSGSQGRQPVAPGPTRLDQRVPPSQIRDGRVLVRPQHFTADALAARQAADRNTPAAGILRRSHASCAVPGARGVQVNATYQRAPAVLVFHAPGSGTQVVDLYLCGSARPVRSATLPGPQP